MRNPTNSSGCINYGFDFNPPLLMVLVTNFAFPKKAKDDFGRNVVFQKTKVMVSGTSY
jgi:hypothetical protein